MGGGERTKKIGRTKQEVNIQGAPVDAPLKSQAGKAGWADLLLYRS